MSTRQIMSPHFESQPDKKIFVPKAGVAHRAGFPAAD